MAKANITSFNVEAAKRARTIETHWVLYHVSKAGRPFRMVVPISRPDFNDDAIDGWIEAGMADHKTKAWLELMKEQTQIQAEAEADTLNDD